MKISNKESMSPSQKKALARYQVISAYLALDPPRGQRRKVLRQLANRTWTDLDGMPFTAAVDTIRSWVRQYRKKGLDGLKDKPRTSGGITALTPEQVDLVCQLKKEVPERSLDRLITIAEGMGLFTPGRLSRSTLHRVLKKHGLSKRTCHVPDRQDLDRFEADLSNDLWHSDMLVGPWLPDPQRPHKMRRAYLYAFLDDHSRRLLHGRFSFKGDLPALELVFRRALQKYGCPRRCYYDNGQVYRSGHMQQIVATLGIHRIHTRPYRPMGNGKIEAFNRLVRSAFIAELKTSSIRTLEELNEAFIAWSDLEYNQRIHGETGQTPKDRYQQGLKQLSFLEEETLRQAFLWTERRTPDKTGIFSLWGKRYQVGPELNRRRVEVRYDPEALDDVEVFYDGQFVERAQLFAIQPHRRPKPTAKPQTPSGDVKKPAADWLGALVKRRRDQEFIEPTMTDAGETGRQILDLLFEELDEAVVQQATVQTYLRRFGPFDPERAQTVIRRMVEQGRRDLHIAVYLDAIREAHRGRHR